MGFFLYLPRGICNCPGRVARISGGAEVSVHDCLPWAMERMSWQYQVLHVVSVLVVDRRGFGISSRRPTELRWEAELIFILVPLES